mmetsp:Transcript_67913/g.147972  ORF Transcript_67913/g.147972 Transcript_67913/m.147972 type:complete len:291 (-) Transcript_67913:377-1249(-)
MLFPPVWAGWKTRCVNCCLVWTSLQTCLGLVNSNSSLSNRSSKLPQKRKRPRRRCHRRSASGRSSIVNSNNNSNSNNNKPLRTTTLMQRRPSSYLEPPQTAPRQPLQLLPLHLLLAQGMANLHLLLLKVLHLKDCPNLHLLLPKLLWNPRRLLRQHRQRRMSLLQLQRPLQEPPAARSPRRTGLLRQSPHPRLPRPRQQLLPPRKRRLLQLPPRLPQEHRALSLLSLRGTVLPQGRHPHRRQRLPRAPLPPLPPTRRKRRKRGRQPQRPRARLEMGPCQAERPCLLPVRG